MKENFTKEVESLLLQIEARINDFSHGIAIEDDKASKQEASDMNTLKLHRYKMKELLIAMKSINDETWRMKRESFKAAFEDAEKTLTLTP